MTTGEWFRRVPWSVVVIAAALMLVGATGILRGDELAGKSDFFARQVVWIVCGLVALFAATVLPYRAWRPLSYPLFFVSLGLMLVTLFVVMLLWENHLVYVLGGCALLYLGLGLVIGVVLRRRLKARPRLFATTLAELAKDRDQLTR